jgi:CheY-like chemotaxis protein
MATKEGLKIILLDDVREVRQLFDEILSSSGSVVRSVATTEDLLYALRAEQFDVAVLDILLSDDDKTIGETLDLARKLFPEQMGAFQHERVVAELAATVKEAVSGRYILPMLKAISPQTEVIMMTSTLDGIEEDDGYFRRWGAFAAIAKYDARFDSREELLGLDHELVDSLREIRRKKEANV